MSTPLSATRAVRPLGAKVRTAAGPTLVVFTLFGLLSPSWGAATAAESLLAFTGAEGAGRFAAGGRGGRVIKVANLDDSGPGSLREAVEASGPRTILFEVSGTIALLKPLKITSGALTIAGQSAPGDGITLRDQPLIVAADDVVVRYLRSRLGDVSGVQTDAISVTKGRRIVLDHLSASWSVDEALSVSAEYLPPDEGPFDVTVQWCIISESLNASRHEKGEHGYGTLTRGGRGSHFSFHHNLWASHFGRMPRPGNYRRRSEDTEGAFFDFRNNVFYNWAGKSSGYNADTQSLASYNFINNAYVPGPDSGGRYAFKESNPFARAHFAGNAMDGRVPADPWSLVMGVKVPANRLAKPIEQPPVVTESWDRAYRRVLAQAGASIVRDSVDKRTVEGVQQRSNRIINSQSKVGGWPLLASGVAPHDSDGDGMPDEWERGMRFDPHNPEDAQADHNGDGYTNLEDYLQSLIDVQR